VIAETACRASDKERLPICPVSRPSARRAPERGEQGEHTNHNASPLHIPYALGQAASPARLRTRGEESARPHPAQKLMASICRHARRGLGAPTDCEALVAISSSERLPLRCSRNLHTCSAWHLIA
jgi:hypothetical protein